MPTEAKRKAVAELQEELSRYRTLIISEYRGLTVKELSEIRRGLRRHGVSYRVVKNRLVRIAAGEGRAGALESLLTGPTAIAFGDDETQTAKAVLDVTRPYRVLKITGGLLGDRMITAEGVTRLAMLPGREVLLARLAGAIQSPTATLAGLLGANLRNLGSALAQLRDQRASEA